MRTASDYDVSKVRTCAVLRHKDLGVYLLDEPPSKLLPSLACCCNKNLRYTALAYSGSW